MFNYINQTNSNKPITQITAHYHIQQ